MLSTEELLRKAVLNVTGPGGDVGTADFGGSGQAPLSIEQVTQFIELMTAQQAMLADVRTVHSSASKWQESVISFSDRIAKPGIEGNRLAAASRKKPVTNLVEMSTVLIRGEVPITDEVMEDNVAGTSLVASLERLISDRFGFDIEDLFVNGDEEFSDGSADDIAWYSQVDGWITQAKEGKANGNTGNPIDGSADGKDYQAIFRKMLQTMPYRHLRTIETDGRYYVPKRTEFEYRDILSARGGVLGELSLTTKNELRYQGILILGVPSFRITSGDTGNFLLTNKNNLYAGYHRSMKFESWRDPREGVTSFVITARVDPEVAICGATVLAYDVDVSV